MRVIIGLGNPGSEYQHTRHNIGFDIVDAVAAERRIVFDAGRGEFLIARGSYRENEFALIKPLTYMNNSGIAVVEVLNNFGVTGENLLVVVDDFHIPLGILRLRRQGSSGGHNGLYSIMYHLQSENFPRLRFGIGSENMPKQKSGMADFVLSQFAHEELDIVRTGIIEARNKILEIIFEGIT